MKHVVRILVLSLALALFPALAAAAATPATVLDEWRPDPQQQTFTANDLYGHINGGAELFLEFGFSRLTVTHWEQDDFGIDVEVYHMTDAGAALGIFLARCGRETPLAGVSARNSGNQYQLIAVRGDVYLQVNSFSGTATLVPAMIELAEEALDGIPDAKEPAVFSLLPTAKLVPSSRRLVRGPFGLEPVYTLGEGDILSLGGKVFAATGWYRSDDDEWTQIIAAYPDAEQATQAFDHLRRNLDSLLHVLEGDESGLVFSDWREKIGRVRLEGNVLSIMIGLDD